MKNKFVIYMFAGLGVLVFPFLLISAINIPTEKIVYVPKIVEQTRFVNMNISLHGASINTVIQHFRDFSPVDYDKVIWFYNQKIKDKALTITIVESALDHDVPVNLAVGMAYQETSFIAKQITVNPATKHRAASFDVGLFQLNTLSHKRWTMADLLNPKKNTDEAMTIISQAMAKHSDLVLDFALVDYNAGSNSLPNSVIPFTTSIHVFKVRAYEQQLDHEFCKYLIPMLNVSGIDFSKLD